MAMSERAKQPAQALLEYTLILAAIALIALGAYRLMGGDISALAHRASVALTNS